jgi:hypothetical protein
MSFTQTKCASGVCGSRRLPDPLRKFTELYPAELYAFARTEVPATGWAPSVGGFVGSFPAA